MFCMRLCVCVSFTSLTSNSLALRKIQFNAEWGRGYFCSKTYFQCVSFWFGIFECKYAFMTSLPWNVLHFFVRAHRLSSTLCLSFAFGPHRSSLFFIHSFLILHRFYCSATAKHLLLQNGFVNINDAMHNCRMKCKQFFIKSHCRDFISMTQSILMMMPSIVCSTTWTEYDRVCAIHRVHRIEGVCTSNEILLAASMWNLGSRIQCIPISRICYYLNSAVTRNKFFRGSLTTRRREGGWGKGKFSSHNQNSFFTETNWKSQDVHQYQWH